MEHSFFIFKSSVQFSSVAQSCSTLCDPMNRSTPGLPVHHQLLEFTQTHIHQVSDAIQPSHPLSSPSPPAPNPSQHQSLFQWVNSLHEVAKVLLNSFHIHHIAVLTVVVMLYIIFLIILYLEVCAFGPPSSSSPLLPATNLIPLSMHYFCCCFCCFKVSQISEITEYLSFSDSFHLA